MPWHPPEAAEPSQDTSQYPPVAFTTVFLISIFTISLTGNQKELEPKSAYWILKLQEQEIHKHRVSPPSQKDQHLL